MLKSIPSVDKILSYHKIKILLESIPRQIVVFFVRSALDTLRNEIQFGDFSEETITESTIVAMVKREAHDFFSSRIRKVINASGIILHTGLGRSPFPHSVCENFSIFSSYTNVQIDINSGEREERDVFAKKMLLFLTGAESAVIVNNNAAATLLVLNTFAEKKEVIVSRGQLIEIGGSFRLPEIMAKSGAFLKEVGTTNRTRFSDYENAVNDSTAMIFKAHTSNYKIIGFTEEVASEDLARLASRRGLIFADDLGAASFIDLDCIKGFSCNVKESLKKGSDLVFFSGDKLLGGPQCGIILGKKDLIEKIEKNPLTRAMRVCKLTSFALAEILMLYCDMEKMKKVSPFLAALYLEEEELRDRVQKLSERIKEAVPILKCEIREATSYVGGGSFPMEALPDFSVMLTSNISPHALAERLRKNSIPIIARVTEDKVFLNMRTLLPEDEAEIANALKKIFSGSEKPGL